MKHFSSSLFFPFFSFFLNSSFPIAPPSFQYIRLLLPTTARQYLYSRPARCVWRTHSTVIRVAVQAVEIISGVSFFFSPPALFEVALLWATHTHTKSVFTPHPKRRREKKTKKHTGENKKKQEWLF